VTIQSERKNKDVRWWDILAVVLIVAAILTSATRLVATRWVSHLTMVQNVAVWGVIAGLALGKSKFPRGVVFLFAVAYGIFVIPWQLGLTMAEGIEWRERIFSMVGRITLVIRDLLSQRDIQDNLFFLSIMALMFWVFGVYAGFQIVRNANVWRAVLPAGLVLFVLHMFDAMVESRAWYIPVYIFLSLMLLARIHFLKQRRKWESERTHIPTDVGLDLGRIALGISIIIIFIAWNAPIMASTVSGFTEMYSNFNRPWLSLKDRMSFMFASLRASVGFVSDSFGNVETLGLGSQRSNAIVMSIQAPAYPFVGARYYWRARVYDEYQSGTWTSNLLQTMTFTPDKNYFKQDPAQNRFDAVFAITPYLAMGELFLPSQPVWVSRPGKVQYGSTSPDNIDLVAFQAVPYIRPGEVYQARSSLASITQYRMRLAGTEYPQWVLDRYLQLPENITPRTRELAQHIAQGLTNPYDITEAVTEYLRRNIEYQVTIDPPPKGQEVIDWFLFDYKKGFCNYYATAEVVLLRSLGIPARWAVGYAEGERVLTEEQMQTLRRGQDLPETTSMDIASFNIRQKDAHAWPEVYFPGSGWVEFEPTVSQSPIIRPRGQSSDPSAIQNPAPIRNFPDLEPTPAIPNDGQNRNQGNESNSGTNYRNLVFGLFLMLIGGVVLFIYLSRDRNSRVGRWWEKAIQGFSEPLPIQIANSFRRLGFTPPHLIRQWANQALLSPLGRAYQEVNKALSRLQRRLPNNATPAERADALKQVLPEADRHIRRLLNEYELGTYSTHPADTFSAQQASSEIRRMSITARFHNWFSWLFSKPLKK
jgi:transglutaminase-like putative cysteine protease